MNRFNEIDPRTSGNDNDFLFCLFQKDEAESEALEKLSMAATAQALRHTNKVLAEKLREKDEIIAWLSGGYSVSAHRGE
ncbi:MAG: hypothetical protein H6862_04290 [Rhodospirillales bacterium]|nr:hypothetical protein [Rhodospirillales bacterium]